MIAQVVQCEFDAAALLIGQRKTRRNGDRRPRRYRAQCRVEFSRTLNRHHGQRVARKAQ